MMAVRFASLLFVSLALGGCAASLRPPTTSVSVAPPASVAEADAKLAQAARERVALEAAYAEGEAVCYRKFFVSRCLDEAREQRRIGLARVKAVEVAMERYKREAAVAQRDRALAKADADFQAEEAQRAAEPAPKRTAQPDPVPSAPAAKTVAERRAERAASERAAAADAASRGAKAGEAAQRRADYAQRQRDAAAKKAERAARNAREAAKRAQEDAAAAKAAAKNAPAGR